MIAKLIEFIRKYQNRVNLVLVAYFFLLLLFRLFNFINIFSINFPEDDQWWVIDMIIKKKSFFELFSYLYNEHRIGVGLILTKILAHFTKWNTRYESFGVGIILVLIALLALRLKYRYSKKISIFDIAIPFLFFNLNQYENLLAGFRLFYLLPILFLFLYFWLLESSSNWRYVSILILIVLSSRTGFHGLFLGIFAILLIIFEIIKTKKLKENILKSILFLTIIFVEVSYFFNFPRASSDFTIPKSSFIIEIPVRMINQVIGYRSDSFLLFLIPNIVIFCFIYFIYLFVRKKDLSLYPIFCLYLYPILFIICILFGRNKYGIDLANASRYISHISILYFALYLTCVVTSNKALKCLIMIFIIIPVIFNSVFTTNENYLRGMIFKTNKNNWIACYIRKKSVTYCNEVTGYRLLYGDFSIMYLPEKINLLKMNKLSYFATD